MKPTQSDANFSPFHLTSHGLLVIAFVILLFSLGVYFVYAANLISFPFDYDQGEGFELVDTIMFSQGQWPYQNTEAYPFYSSNYPPLFHILAVPFVWLFGEAYWYGRLLGFLGTLLSAGLIFYAVYREGKIRWIAALSALAFLASNTVYHIGPLLRQHMTMVLFELLAIILLARGFPNKDRKQIIFGLLMLVAAGYTKQLAAITAVAALAWMFLRNPRRAILWGIGFTLVGGAIFAWMTWATNGEWWRQAIVANVNDFNPLQTFYLAQLWFQLHGFLIVPTVLYVLYETVFERWSIYSVWFGFAVVLGALGSGTWGAGDSYFATAIAATCILSGLLFSRVISQTENRLFKQSSARLLRTVGLIVIPLLYIGYGIATFKMPTQGLVFEQVANIFDIEANVRGNFYDSATYNVLGYAHIGYLLTEEDFDAGYYMVDLIQSAKPPVMSEEAGLCIVAGCDVVTNPTQLLNLWKAGMFDGSELIGMIENHEFGLIIMRAQFYPEPVLIAISTYYELDEIVLMNDFEYQIWRPKEAS